MDTSPSIPCGRNWLRLIAILVMAGLSPVAGAEAPSAVRTPNLHLNPAGPLFVTWRSFATTPVRRRVQSRIDLPPLAPTNTTWVGGAGNWNSSGNWTNGIPNGNFNAFIDGGNATVSPVTLDINASVNNLAISAGDSLAIGNNLSLTLNGTNLTNNGGLTLNSAGNVTSLLIGGPSLTLSGGGTVTMSNNSQNYIYGTVGTNVLTNQGTIQGGGTIGNNQLTLVNSGTINANSPTKLIVNPSGGTTNTGTLTATAAGTLDLRNAITNTGGTITASGAGSIVQIDGATVTGGTLSTSSGGVIQSLGGTISGLTNSGTLQVPNNNATTLLGTLNNTGDLQLNSGGNATQLIVGSPTATLSGVGTVTLSNNSQNYILGTTSGNTLTNQQTIQGAGTIGSIGLDQLTLVNQGTINANVATPLIITPSGGTTNTGILEATAGGTLDLRRTITNSGGNIVANGSGSKVLINGATVTGGTLSTPNGGVIQSFGGTFSGVANTGTLQVSNNTSATLVGTTNNTGAIQLNSGGNITSLLLTGTVQLAGGGTVTLSDNSQNYIYGPTGTALVNQAGNTISGAGNIGNGTTKFTNKGIVNAVSAHSNHLIVNTGTAGSVNLGTMEASSGGTLELHNRVTNSNGTTSGLIEALAGGVVSLAGATVSGGTLTTVGSGVITASSATLDGSTNLVTNSGKIQVANNKSLSLKGPIANSGSISLKSGGNQTFLKIVGPTVTLQGAGSVILSDNSQNFIQGSTTGTEQLINQQTIKGAGNIGNGFLTLTNQGTIIANSTTGNHLVIQGGSGGVTNTGSMQAVGGATLDLKNTVTNTGGTISAGSGSTVLLNGATVTGGTLNGTGTIVSNNATLSGLTSAATLQVANNTSVTLVGSINNTGAIQLNSGGNITQLLASGAVTLSGGGAITLSDNSQNYLSGTSGSSITNQSSTISGTGNIGNTLISFTNNGTVNANSAIGNHLVIQAGAGGATNHGLMEATGGGTLELQNSVTNTGATITAGAGSTVLMNGGTVTGGTLNGAGTFTSTNATLSGLTNAGSLQVANNVGATLVGTINNTGTIQLNSAGNVTQLLLTGPVTLAGGGAVNLSDNSQNYIWSTTGGTLLNQNNSITGSGNIGNGTTGFTNQGTVNATSAGSNHLIISSGSAGAVNSSIMEASSGGTLELRDTVNNAGGTIEALAGTGTAAGGTVTLNGGTITGGTLTTLGSGVNAGVVTSTGGTLSGLTNSGSVQVGNNNFLNLKGNIVNTGNIALNSGGNLTRLLLNGNVTLSGTGTVTLSNNSQNFIYGTAGTEVLTNTSTIQGSGTIGNNAMGLVNGGTILANQTTALLINASVAGGFSNPGKLQSNAGSTLQVTGPFSNFAGTTLTGGTYVVGGTLKFDNANIMTNAANITLTGAASLLANQSGVNALTNFTTNAAAGRFTLSGGQNLTTAGGSFSNGGILSIGAGSIFTVGNGGNTSIAVNYTQTGGTTTIDGTLASSATTAGTPTLNLNAGSLLGTGTVSQVVSSSGTVSPGDTVMSTGKLTISGTYAQNPTGALGVSIGGVTAGTKYDQLNVTGSASLNGTLNIQLINGFVPTLGSTFNVVHAGSRAGTFTTVTGTAINANEHFAVTYNGTDVLLTVVAGAGLSPGIMSRIGVDPLRAPAARNSIIRLPGFSSPARGGLPAAVMAAAASPSIVVPRGAAPSRRSVMSGPAAGPTGVKRASGMIAAPAAMAPAMTISAPGAFTSGLAPMDIATSFGTPGLMSAAAPTAAISQRGMGMLGRGTVEFHVAMPSFSSLGASHGLRDIVRLLKSKNEGGLGYLSMHQ